MRALPFPAIASPHGPAVVEAEPRSRSTWYIRWSLASALTPNAGDDDPTAVALVVTPFRCSGMPEPMLMPRNGSGVVFMPSSHRPTQPEVGGPPGPQPCIHVAIDVKWLRSGLG